MSKMSKMSKMSGGAAATANTTQGRFYMVTLPDGRVVISSQPLLHNERGNAVNALTTRPVRELDWAALLLLAKFIVLNNENVTFVKFSNQKVIDVYLPWINIFQFLLGPTFQTHVAYNPAQQLARFSACIARPSLLLATDDVVRAVLCGDEGLARRMIALRNPNYLLQRGNATDFSGRTYTNLTPFQAALITGDDAMVKMIKPYFAHLPNGEAIIQAQFAEIFPDGIEAHLAEQKRESEAKFTPMLEEVIAAIKDAELSDLQSALNNECNGSRLYLVLNKFRAAFNSLSHNEKIFNPQHLLKAFEAYANKFDWSYPDWNKLDLFWRQVIGFAQRFLPANYAQVFAYDLYDVVENKHLCRRSFHFRYDSGFSFYPLGCSSTGLGFNYAVWGAAARARATGAPLAYFKTYVEQKQQAFRTYCAPMAINLVRTSM